MEYVTVMGELRTLIMSVEVSPGGLASTEILIEKTMRIKKVQMNMTWTDNVASGGNLLLSKKGAVGTLPPATREAGHIMFLSARSSFVTSGFPVYCEHEVLDLGQDYIEVEEDNYLYLSTKYLGSATLWGSAIIFYEE